MPCGRETCVSARDVVVLVSAYLVYMNAGVVFVNGLLVTELLATFEQGETVTTWVVSLQLCLALFLGFLSGSLVELYGCRLVAYVGTMVAVCGYVMSAFTNSIGVLFLTYSLISGVGLGIQHIPCLTVPQLVFTHGRALATAFVLSGASTGSFVYPVLFNYFRETYGWRGGLLLLGGIIFQSVPLSYLMTSHPNMPAGRPSRDTHEPERTQSFIESQRPSVRTVTNREMNGCSVPDSASNDNLYKISISPSHKDDILYKALYNSSLGALNGGTSPMHIRAAPIPEEDTAEDTPTRTLCGVSESGVSESGVSESGVSEPGVRESGVSESGVSEPGVRESGVRDSGVMESGERESGVRESGVKESNVSEFGVRESGVRDSGVMESGERESGVRESGVKESGERESGVRESGVKESDVSESGVRESGVRESIVRISSDTSGANHSPPNGLNHVNSRRSSHLPHEGSVCDSHRDLALSEMSINLSEAGLRFPSTSMPQEFRRILSEMWLGFRELRNGSCIVVLMVVCVFAAGYQIPYIFLPIRVAELGFSKQQGAWLLSIIGIADTVFRLGFGGMANVFRQHIPFFYGLSMLACAVGSTGMGMATTYGSLQIFSVIFGAGVGGFSSLYTQSAIVILGLSKIIRMLGLMAMAWAISFLVSPTLSASIYENTGNLDIAFWLSTAFQSLAAVIHVSYRYSPCYKTRPGALEEEAAATIVAGSIEDLPLPSTTATTATDGASIALSRTSAGRLGGSMAWQGSVRSVRSRLSGVYTPRYMSALSLNTLRSVHSRDI